MRGIHPAVEAEAEAAAHAVGVFFIAKRAEEDLSVVGDVIAIGVGEVPDVRDAPSDAAGLVFGFVPGQHSCGNVQLVGEVGDFVGTAVAVGVFEDFDGIAAAFDVRALRITPAGFFGGVGILDGGGDPQAATGIEGHVDGLVDLGLAGEELDFKAGWHMKTGAFLFRRQRIGFAHEAEFFLGGMKRESERRNDGKAAEEMHGGITAQAAVLLQAFAERLTRINPPHSCRCRMKHGTLPRAAHHRCANATSARD
jgi:hypothetical protein